MKMDALDYKRYEIEAPMGRADESAWIKALNNSDSQLEHQKTR